MPVVETKASASAQGYGLTLKAIGGDTGPTYVEDVFSTYTYTGTGATQSINNGIDLQGRDGLVWIKGRNGNIYGDVTAHQLHDSIRGITNTLNTNSTSAQYNNTTGVNSFNNNGFSIGSDAGYNDSGYFYTSWSFRKKSKFFDIVTYTGNGATSRALTHNLNSVPGCIFIKRTDTTSNWSIYHTSIGATKALSLNLPNAATTSNTFWNDTTPGLTTFTVGNSTTVNASGGTYVAYLFAHNSGGFGELGTDNIISCGTYTGNGLDQGPFVELGFEPQFVLIKSSDDSQNWVLFDNIRGMTVSSTGSLFYPNSTSAEIDSLYANVIPQPTGFKLRGSDFTINRGTINYIYIAIRRGNMKKPTVGTSVFNLNARTGTGSTTTVVNPMGQTDFSIIKNRGSALAATLLNRLTGNGYLRPNGTAGETIATTAVLPTKPWDDMTGLKVGSTSTLTNASTNTFINYLFKRANGFFDQIVYTGTLSNTTVPHGLKAIPELMIFKSRVGAVNWTIYHKDLGPTKGITLNGTGGAVTSAAFFNNTAPTDSVISLGTSNTTNSSTVDSMLCYLFTTCLGVSKVGSYIGTGTGTTLQIDCGFTTGARFVLIKRNSTGNWFIWDTARGITSGNDPYFILNDIDAEITTTSYINPYIAGFEISTTAPAAINALGGEFIFFAIA